MLVTPSLVFAAVLAQINQVIPTPPANPKPFPPAVPGGVSAPAKISTSRLPTVNDTLVVASSAVATSPEALRLLVMVMSLAEQHPEETAARYRTLVATGLILELNEATPLLVSAVVAEEAFRDDRDRPVPVYGGTLRAGPLAGRLAFIVAGQIYDAAKDRERAARRAAMAWAIPPLPGDADGAAAYATAKERRAAVYKQARSAMAAAMGTASRKDAGIRAAVLARETREWKRALAKENYIDAEGLEAILAEGEAADGTAFRKGEKRAATRAKAGNNEQLEAFDRSLAPALAAANRAANAPTGSLKGGKTIHLPRGLMTFYPGHPWNHYEADVKMRTK